MEDREGSISRSIRAKERLTEIGISSASERELIHRVQRGAIPGMVLGLLAFFGGLALLVFTFKLAFTMFGSDPYALLGIGKGKVLDLNTAAATLMAVVVKILLLVVMAAVGGVIAKHGIHLYADSRSSPQLIAIHKRDPEPTEPRRTKEDELGEHSRRERMG